MTDEFTQPEAPQPESISEANESDGTIQPSKDGPYQPSQPFLIIHTNAAGHAFATRVEALDEDSAKSAVLGAHEDNTIVEVQPDDGRSHHGYGGSLLEVHTLDEEP